MAIQPEEITFVLSGGSTNTDINDSLGGEPSLAIIGSGLLNNLFPDVSEEENRDGLIDYRCFYVFNDAVSGDTFYNARMWITSEVEEGSNITIGTVLQDEIQQVQISGKVVAGFFTINFDGYVLDIEHPGDVPNIPDEWALDFQTKLRSLPILSDVTVDGTADLELEVVTFEVRFVGRDGKRSQELILLKDEATDTFISNSATLAVNTLLSPPPYNGLKPETTGVIPHGTSSRIIPGSPINAIAPTIEIDTIAPENVIFSFPTEKFPLTVGDLFVNDGFFMWVQRTTAANSEGVERDGVSLRIKGSATT